MEKLGRGRGRVAGCVAAGGCRSLLRHSSGDGEKSTEPVCSAAESCRASHVWVEVTSGGAAV